MKPFNTGGHSAYQNRVLTQLRKYYPDADSSFDSATWDTVILFFFAFAFTFAGVFGIIMRSAWTAGADASVCVCGASV